MGESAIANGDIGKEVYTLADLKAHATEKDCFILVHGKVYNVTEFLDEHPGGYDIILNTTGRDATEDFEEIGHSNAARDMLEKYIIGNYEGGDSAAADTAKQARTAAAAPSSSDGGGALATLLKALLPLLIIALAAYFGLGSKK